MLRKTIVMICCLMAFFALYLSVQPSLHAQPQTIQFSGYTWEVRSGGGGPGPNNWAAQNVWVDANGYLHLKISYVNGQWYAAELSSTQLFGFGTYQWQLMSRVDQLDPNVVLGLFTYPHSTAIGPDGTNEIDIEFARWGSAAWPNLNYTVYPAVAGPAPTSDTYNFALNGDYSTHRFAWSSKQVFYQSLHGHTDANTNEFHRWTFAPQQPIRNVPQQAIPVHMNLWLFEGRAPTNGQEVEVIISKFTYTPATPTPPTPTFTPTFTPTATATPTAGTLAAPSNLAATTVSDVQINLAWTDHSSTESGFKVERCQGPNCTAFTQVAATGANVRSYTDATLAPNTTYCYRTRAYTSTLHSAYSNTVCSTTGPLPPTNLAASRLLATEVNLAWVETSTNETGFKLERCTGRTCTNFAQIALLPTNGIGYHNTDLSPNTVYRYRVAATNGNGNSRYSALLTMTTPAALASAQPAMGVDERAESPSQPIFPARTPLMLEHAVTCLNGAQPATVMLRIGDYRFPMTLTAAAEQRYSIALPATSTFADTTDYLLQVDWQCADSATLFTDYAGLLQSPADDAAPVTLERRLYLPALFTK